MTIRYINPANDAPFVSDGGAPPNIISTVQIQVPNNQYWLPRLIKVGLLGYPGTLNLRPFQPRLLTKLYHGTPNDTSPGAFIDSTVNTWPGDVTAILNGTMLQPGEWITAITTTLNSVSHASDSWSAGLVYLEVDGLTTDSFSEAANLVVASAPGPAFRGQLAYPMAMPPMGDRSVEQAFFNPGQNNAVHIIASAAATGSSQNLFIYNVTIEAFTSPAVINADGVFEPIPPISPPGVNVDPFMYYNPYSANASIPFGQEFHGMEMLPGGLQWFQLGNAAANSVAYGVSVTFRDMPI